MVVHVLYNYNHLTGGAGVKEPKDLQGSDGRCPDLQMVTNNEHVLTDVPSQHSRLLSSHLRSWLRPYRIQLVPLPR